MRMSGKSKVLKRGAGEKHGKLPEYIVLEMKTCSKERNQVHIESDWREEKKLQREVIYEQR